MRKVRQDPHHQKAYNPSAKPIGEQLNNKKQTEKDIIMNVQCTRETKRKEKLKCGSGGKSEKNVHKKAIFI